MLLDWLGFETPRAFTALAVYSFGLLRDMDNQELFSQMIYGVVHTYPMAFAFAGIGTQSAVDKDWSEGELGGFSWAGSFSVPRSLHQILHFELL